MSTNQPKNNNEEEVDLGSLFLIIGKGFTKFFNFIGSIFKGIFHAFIVVLLFIKTNIIAIAIAGIVGGIVGFFLESKSPDLYGSEMLVKPNYESSKLLYDNIRFYNDVIQQDLSIFQKKFNISEDVAKSIRSFDIKPVISENDIISSYNDFVLSIDTTAVKNYSYKSFKSSFKEYDYKVHRIEVIAEKKDVFSKLENTIISSVEKNAYFNRLKTFTHTNLNTTDALIKKSIAQIDSLQSAFVKSTIVAAQKATSGTNIDLGSSNSRPKEVELLETNRRLISDLEKVVKDRSEKNVVINIVSSFKPVGYKIGGVTKNYIFLLGILGSLLAIFVLLIKQLNTYLNNYKK